MRYVVLTLALATANQGLAEESVAPEAEPVPNTAAPATEAATEPAPTTEALAPLVEEVNDEPADEAIHLSTRVNGYLDARGTYTRVRTHRLLPSDDIPTSSQLVEASFLLKLGFGDAGFVLGDASFIYQHGSRYFGEDATGAEVRRRNHDVPAYRPLTVLSELYGSYNVNETTNLTLGKKRIVWGSGLAVNPSDLLNPAKDPTDPTSQRAGAWLMRLEMPFETFTLSAVGAVRALRQYDGVPSALGAYPTYDTYESSREAAQYPDDGDPLTPPFGRLFPSESDSNPHYALALRGYALIADTDVNAVYYLTNLYNDAFEQKSRFALSGSRYVTDTLELHFEGLLQRGSARLYANPSCTKDLLTAGFCILDEKPVTTRSRLDDTTPVVRGLAGARYTFDDDAMLSLEYEYVGDGYSDSELSDYVRLLRLVKPALANPLAAGVVASSGLLGGASADPGTPQKFAFEPLRRNYLFISYSKPRIFDDFTLQLVAIANLDELTTQLAPSLTWNALEWLNLTLYGAAPLPGPKSQLVLVDGKRYGESTIVPVDWRVSFGARAFY